MKAIIVPGVTDLNKGDQALVWESYRIVSDTHLFDKIYILSNGDTPFEEQQLCAQTIEKGFELIPNIIPHPRRGKHLQGKVINEGRLDLVKQVATAMWDYFTRSAILKFAPQKALLQRFFGQKVIETLKVFNDADTIFVKGGGFIHAHGEKTAPYVIWYLLFYVNLAKRLKKKVVFLPNSYGPFEGVTVKKQITNAFKKMELKLAREHISAAALGNLLEEEIQVLPDLGFYLKAKDKSFGASLLQNYKTDASQKKVGITIRPWRFPGLTNVDSLYEKYISSVHALIVYLNSAGYQVLFFNQSMGPNTHEDDRNAIRYLITKLEHENFLWIDENFTCEELKSIYSNLDFFIGTRFHSVIFSMTAGVPSLAIAYGGNKGQGIMQDFNLSDYVVHINDVTPEILTSKFKDLELHEEKVRQVLKEKTQQLETKRNATINLIKKKLNS